MIVFDGPPLIQWLLVLSFFATLASGFGWLFAKTPSGPPETPPARLSALAGASFSFGLLTALLVLASVIAGVYVEFADVAETSAWDHEELRFGSLVLRLVALGPGLAAFAFGLAALGAIRESHPGLRGRALARMGLTMSLLAAAALLL